MTTAPGHALELPAPGQQIPVRALTRLLLAAQAALSATVGIFFALVTANVAELGLGGATTGVAIGVWSLAAAGGAFAGGRLMTRLTRRHGLVLGHALVAVAGAALVVALASRTSALFLCAVAVFGGGVGAGSLGRVVVADLHAPARRARVIGFLVLAGAAGAMGGPAAASAVGGSGADGLLTAWSLVPALGLAGLVAASRLRPCPGELAEQAEDAQGIVLARPVRELLASRPVRMAVAASAASQVTMITVMGLAPAAVHEHHGAAMVAYVTIVHQAGMYLFAPVIGALLDRHGRRPGLVGGIAVMAAGAVLSSLPGSGGLVAAGFLLLGVGWSATYLAATAVLTDLTGAREQAGLLAAADLATSLAAAAGVAGGGLAATVLGPVAVGAASACLLAIPLTLALLVCEPRRGHWVSRRRPRGRCADCTA